MVRQLVLICWPLEVIRKELANYVHSVFYQSSQAIHAIRVPLTPIFASFVPSVVSQPLALVSHELSCVDITSIPAIASISMLTPLIKVAFIRFLVVEYELTCTLLKVILPEALVNIPIFIVVNALESKIALEGASEDVSIEQPKLSFYL